MHAFQFSHLNIAFYTLQCFNRTLIGWILE